jgi:hypothetical protein
VRLRRRICGGTSCGRHPFGSQGVVCELVISACEADVEETYPVVCERKINPLAPEFF